MPPKPQRRRQILGAAAQLFRERGFQATTMDDLAGKLKLNKATVYHHFSDGKSDLLFQIYVSAIDEMLECFARVDPTAPAAERLQRYVEAMIALQVERADEAVVYFQERPWLSRNLSRTRFAEFRDRELEVLRMVRTAIEDGIATGEFLAVDPQQMTAIVMDVASSAHRWSRVSNADLSQIQRTYSRVVLRGLSASSDIPAPALGT